MSPLMITMLLSYYANARDYRDVAEPQHARSPAVKEAIEAFVELNLIVSLMSDDKWLAQAPDKRPSQYVLSDRGRAMVEAYKAVQLPIIQWVQP